MPLGTLDRNPPPFFKQGPSALSKLMVFSAIARSPMPVSPRSRDGTAVASPRWIEASRRCTMMSRN